MEGIYDPSIYCASETFPTRDYFTEYGEKCRFQQNTLNNDILQERLQLINNEFGLKLSGTDMSALEDLCSIEKLTLKEENGAVPIDLPPKLITRTRIEACYPDTKAAKSLHTVKCRDQYTKANSYLDVKLGNRKFIKTGVVSSVTNSALLRDIMPGSDFVYTIIVYKPFAVNFVQRNSSENLRFSFELEALGSNTLSEIADSITCISDVGVFCEVENTKADLGPHMNVKDRYPSRFFFVDGTFYSDFRHSDAIDYSLPIVKWAKEKKIGNFKSDRMETTKLEVLQPRLGYPYVYLHQGDCEHVFTFSDARLIQEGDCLYSKKYPRVTSLTREQNILCFLCGAHHAKWLVKNSDRFPQRKVFLCTECCDSYLYLDGKKLGEFQLYPYYDSQILMRRLESQDDDVL